MAQLNITLNQEEILQLLSNDQGNAFKKILEDSLNTVMKAESSEQLKAEPYERSEERVGSRNGFRERSLTTRIGNITLKVPKHRNCEPFKTLVFENYSRSESALILGMAEMVVNGVSTRKVSNVMETLCGKSFSKSTVSEATKELDEKVNEWKNRLLLGEYPFLTVDATYFKVREEARVVSKALMIAYATNTDGHREIIGFEAYKNESKATWSDFFHKLKKRGLTGVKMITSDAHEGIKYAICQEFPTVPWQRCQFHFSRNIMDKTPAKYQKGLAGELQEMFNAKTTVEARKIKDKIISDYNDIAENAMNTLEDGFESAMTVMVLPTHLRKFFRTSNQIERLNKELKRRSNVIGIFPNENSLVRLMGSVLLERNEVLQAGKCVFSKETYKKITSSDIFNILVKIAEVQHQLLAA